ncbi:hypothetical protein Tco_1413253, partial [Tanacetum coccineum]
FFHLLENALLLYESIVCGRSVRTPCKDLGRMPTKSKIVDNQAVAIHTYPLFIMLRLLAISKMVMTSNNVHFIASFIPLIKEYLVKVNERRAFWSLNEDILKITILKTNTPYPSRRYNVSVPELTKDHEGKKPNTPYPEEGYTPYR